MNTDLCSSSKHHVHTPVSLRKPLRCGFTVLLCSCLLFGATHCRAQESQDAAEAARQERARKEQSKPEKHVYTEDDLGRAKILTPEDEARFAASRKEIGPAGEQAQGSLDAGVDLSQLPLGDVARRYRNAKLAIPAQTPFHLPFDEPAFASPIVSIAKPEPPRPSFSVAHPNIVPARPNVAVAPAISSLAPLHRVDPFARRSAPAAPSFTRIAPAEPVAHPFVSHPAPAPTAPQANIPAEAAAPKLRDPQFAAVPTAPVSRPSVPRVASAPATPQAHLSTKIAAPKFESPRFAPVPAAPSAVAPETAQPVAVANTSSAVRLITVLPGDSLWKLAQQNLGRGSRWHELVAVNPGIVDPTRLSAGMQIIVPTETTTLKHVKSDTKVAVQQGDTLTKIAQSQYGRAAAWSCIAQANPQIADPNRIYEGQQLLLPFSCKP